MHGSHIHYLSDSLMIITLVQPAKLPAHVGLFRDTKVDIARSVAGSVRSNLSLQ